MSGCLCNDYSFLSCTNQFAVEHKTLSVPVRVTLPIGYAFRIVWTNAFIYMYVYACTSGTGSMHVRLWDWSSQWNSYSCNDTMHEWCKALLLVGQGLASQTIHPTTASLTGSLGALCIFNSGCSQYANSHLWLWNIIRVRCQQEMKRTFRNHIYMHCLPTYKYCKQTFHKTTCKQLHVWLKSKQTE